MPYTNLNEQSFVLGDIQLFREFDMNNFISTARSFITESYQEMKPIDISFYSESVTKALNELKSKHINAKEIMESVKDFSTNYSKPINDISFDVSLIRPKYLTEYVKNAGLTFERVLDGSLTKEEIGRYVSEDVASIRRLPIGDKMDLEFDEKNNYSVYFLLGGLFGIMPLTGIPLPFLSYGGSFTISLICSLAVVQRVAIENKNNKV